MPYAIMVKTGKLPNGEHWKQCKSQGGVPAGLITHHSARVDLWLITTSATAVSLSQVGNDFIILETPFDAEPCDAEIITIIDGVESVRRVYLPNGISADCAEVKIQDLEDK